MYWYINDVNFENITSEELNASGISFSGYYNHYPPYTVGCDYHYSYLTMDGNCINNNTVVYCVVLGDEIGYNDTSPNTTLIVQGKISLHINV